MKNILVVLVLLSISRESFSIITWPRNYSVFQRNTTTSGGSASVAFAGQNLSSTPVSYRIEKLNASGVGIGDWISWNSFPSGSISTLGTSTSKYYYFSLTVPTGWYRFWVRDHNGAEESHKFGVGEVFIIAGQSNAQGAGIVNEIPSIPALDCVVSDKTNLGADLSQFAKLNFSVFGPLNSSNKDIGPRGDRPWFYQALGNSIAQMESGTVIPVCFINVAHGGSSIDNWYDSMQRTKTMFSSNYANPMTIGTTSTHQNPYDAPPYDNRFPYIDLKNVISYWGNMHGVRSVLWHQGESETRTLISMHLSGIYGGGPIPSGYSISDYDTKLNAIIADTRSVLPGLPWAVSKVSLHRNIRVGSGIIDDNIVNNSGNNLTIPGYTTIPVGGMITQEQTNVTSTTSVSWASPGSDNFLSTTNPSTNNRSDGIHFNALGLQSVYLDIFGNIASIISKAPVLPNLPARMYATQVGPWHHRLSTGSYNSYFWSRGLILTYDQTNADMGNNWLSSYSTDYVYVGYTKDAIGRIYAVTPVLFVFPYPGARIAYDEFITESKFYPNPISNLNDLQIEFELKSPSSVKIQLINSRGIIISEIVHDNVQMGKHQYKFSQDKLENINKHELLIYKLITNEHNESKKILIIE